MALRRLPVAFRLGAWLPAPLQSHQLQQQDRLTSSSTASTPPLHFYLSRGWWPAQALAASSALSSARLSLDPFSSAAGCSYSTTAVLTAPVGGERIHVRIKTGNLRGAGTTSPAYITLVGSMGESERILIGDTEGSTFDRATSRSFDVDVARDIGQLRRVHIERAREMSGQLGAGWFLEQVEVQGHGGDSVVFPCNSWFGESDSGDIMGALERNLLPAAEVQHRAVAPCPVVIAASGMSIPHPEKVINDKARGVNRQGFGYAGEDAYFYCHGRNNIFGMGVADGIYAWKEQGIDSGQMARALMEVSMHLVQAGYEDVLKALQHAKRHTEEQKLLGSSTACVLTINKEAGQLHAANLGDSGFLVFGPTPAGEMSIKFRTNQQEHEFGRPFQLGHHQYASQPEDAELASMQVAPGDYVVMGTDGLLDNLSETDIMQEVVRMRLAGQSPNMVAQRLVRLAFEASMDKRRTTPFSKAATEAFNLVYSGGKPDDITVLVAYCD